MSDRTELLFYSGGHPLDPAVRNGLEGPEFGKDIWIVDDCWNGGNVTILPGITIGRGSKTGQAVSLQR
jgi:acetyltransferase-like isoleucine patch superfamily enzyme